MQLLNKGYIIKAAHSTLCTIVVLDRGMDYSKNKERWRWGSTSRNWLRKANMRGNDDTGCSGLLISTNFSQNEIRPSAGSIYKRFPWLQLCQFLYRADFVSIQNEPIIMSKNWFCALILRTIFILPALDANYVFEMTVKGLILSKERDTNNSFLNVPNCACVIKATWLTFPH